MRVEEIGDRVVARFIGTKHERDIKRLAPTITAMNALAPDYEGLTDSEITVKSEQLRAEVKERLGDADPAEDDYKQKLVEALEPAVVPALITFEQAPPPPLPVLEFPPQPLSEAIPVTRRTMQARLRIDLRLRKGRSSRRRARAAGPK